MSTPKLIKRAPASGAESDKLSDLNREGTRLNFADRFKAVGTAFVSIAGTLNTPATVEAIERRFPDWKLRYYAEYI